MESGKPTATQSLPLGKVGLVLVAVTIAAVAWITLRSPEWRPTLHLKNTGKAPVALVFQGGKVHSAAG